ncbi:hypothetical protein [Methylacidimicrobium sp. B4]|uniref:hypothetical protein n=1 Tax=Methylacidimicrobium sp. B4 TaxID=2796139 RepID=UPI001A90AB5D|nr:hypothetical protein [Methylacidimicrobium sp. B4]QSR85000.1 hypothetical protein MacB4_01640 [Methylacidimicrobium sp. B4]
MKNNGMMSQDGTLPAAAAEADAVTPGAGSARRLTPAFAAERASGDSGERSPLPQEAPVSSLPPSGEASAHHPDSREGSPKTDETRAPVHPSAPDPPASCFVRTQKSSSPLPIGPSLRTEKRRPPLLFGTLGGFSAGKNGQAKAEAPARPLVDLRGFSVDRLGWLAGWTLLGASFCYLAAKALPALATSSWWQAGAEASQAIRLRQESERLLEGAHALDNQLAARTRLGPIVAAVAFSSVPALLVDEMEVIAPTATQAGRIQIRIRSYDSDGMGALATFGAMVGLALERGTGRKIRLNPTGLKIPDSLDGGGSQAAEPIRATLIAPLRWEDLR